MTYDYYIELQAAREELQLTELGEASGLTNWKAGTVLEIILTGCVVYVYEALYHFSLHLLSRDMCNWSNIQGENV